MLKPEDIQELRKYLKPNVERGTSLPNPKSVPDDTEFLLRGEDNYFTLHRMIEGKWHIAKVDITSQVYFKPV